MKQDIQAAVSSGKEVTIHSQPINESGFKGFGYIITDPDTGAAAYLIEGKGTGSELGETAEKLLALISGFSLGVSAVMISLLIAGGVAPILTLMLLTILVASIVAYNFSVFSDSDNVCFGVGAALGYGISRAYIAFVKMAENTFNERIFGLVFGESAGVMVAKFADCI